MPYALKIVRKQFPQVKKVMDAKEGVRVTVTKRDSSEGRKKIPSNCALARACVREMKADGAIINVGFSYVITGEIATRYRTSVAVGREITSFDRHQDFAPGDDYLLSAVPPSSRIGFKKTKIEKSGHGGNQGRPVAVHKHQTSDIRVSK